MSNSGGNTFVVDCSKNELGFLLKINMMQSVLQCVAYSSSMLSKTQENVEFS